MNLIIPSEETGTDHHQGLIDAGEVLSAYYRLHRHFHQLLLDAAYRRNGPGSPFGLYVGQLDFVSISPRGVTLDTNVDIKVILRNYATAQAGPAAADALMGAMLGSAFQLLGINQRTLPAAFVEYVLTNTETALTNTGASQLWGFIAPKQVDWRHNLGILNAIRNCGDGELADYASVQVTGMVRQPVR